MSKANRNTHTLPQWLRRLSLYLHGSMDALGEEQKEEAARLYYRNYTVARAAETMS